MVEERRVDSKPAGQSPPFAKGRMQCSFHSAAPILAIRNQAAIQMMHTAGQNADCLAQSCTGLDLQSQREGSSQRGQEGREQLGGGDAEGPAWAGLGGPSGGM